MKRAVSSILIGLLVLASDIIAQERMSRKHEELRGPVRTVRIERAWITLQNDNLVEGPRGLPQIDTFDLNGNKTETSYFQTDGSPGVRTRLENVEPYVRCPLCVRRHVYPRRLTEVQ